MNFKRTLLAAALMTAGIYDRVYDTEPKVPRVKDTQSKLFDTTYIKAVDSRQLKEFSIQGNKVMAFSKKDAITRLKAMGKLKRKK